MFLINSMILLKEFNFVLKSIIKGIILVYTILAVVYLVTPLLSKTVSENIDKSIITKTLYNNNIILNINGFCNRKNRHYIALKIIHFVKVLLKTDVCVLLYSLKKLPK